MSNAVTFGPTMLATRKRSWPRVPRVRQCNHDAESRGCSETHKPLEYKYLGRSDDSAYQAFVLHWPRPMSMGLLGMYYPWLIGLS